MTSHRFLETKKNVFNKITTEKNLVKNDRKNNLNILELIFLNIIFSCLDSVWLRWHHDPLKFQSENLSVVMHKHESMKFITHTRIFLSVDRSIKFFRQFFVSQLSFIDGSLNFSNAI